MKRINKFLIILFVIIFIIILISFYLFFKNKLFMNKYFKTISNQTYIMHALGGLDGKHSYTNSIDALKQTYNEGYRLFEVDISFTSDNQLVCAHSTNGNGLQDNQQNIWTKNDWTIRLGQKYNKNHSLASYDEFMNFKIQGKFKATSFKEIVNFMEEHTDMYIMLDIGNRSYSSTKKIYKAIIESTTNNKDVLNRMIAGGHTTQMMDAVIELYKFPLLNLYYPAENIRQKELKTQKKFIDYCLEHNITSFSTSTSVFKNEDLSELFNSELISYIFTTDSDIEAKMIKDKGATIIGTNFLRNN